MRTLDQGIVKERGMRLLIVIRVRADGYRGQYGQFVKEYFPGLVDEILDNVPMRKVSEKTDSLFLFIPKQFSKLPEYPLPVL